MRSLCPAFTLLTLTLLACRLPAGLVEQTPTPYENDEIPPPGVVQLARQALANELGLTAENISISRIEPTRWEDTCLEMPASGETCEPAEIEGYLVEMKAAGQEYTYHTDLQNKFRRTLQSEWSQAALQSQRLLAGLLGYDPDSVAIISEQPTTFTNSCLDVRIAEITCSEIRTAGIVITLQSGDNHFVFHSALSPVSPVLAEAAGFSTSTATVTWSRQGSRQGLCDDLLLYLNGWAVQY